MPPSLPVSANAALNADLHSHSVVSDGTLTPEDMAARAHAAGVQLWALTDHDEVGGVPRARAAADALGLPFVAGVEISVSFAGQTVHVVGLGVDEHDATLGAALARNRGGREPRARAMAAVFDRLGITNTYDGALAHVGNPELISRTHFARHLVERGVCRDMNDAFRKYLGDGKVAHVATPWAGLGEALGWIHGAGGVAVVAHPARYRFSPTVEYALFSEFTAHGGRGVEVVTGSHTAAEAVRYADLAREFGLAASRGSDFHGPGESRVELGALPALASDLTPVWQLLDAARPLS